MRTTTTVFGIDDIRQVMESIGHDQIMDQLIGRMQDAFEDYDESSYEIPARAGFHYDRPRNGLVEWMPVMSRGSHALMKLVGYHPDNPASSNLPTILSTFSLIDTQTGHMIAISDGTWLTALRTGAASALATRALANSRGGTLGLIGCGAQAVTQLHAISRVYPVELVLYWDTDRQARDSLPDRVAAYLPESTRLRETPLDMIVPNVDVLCTATSISVGGGPLFEHCQTKKGLHINAVGSDFPGKFEIPQQMLIDAIVIPDFAEQAVVEGECQQLPLEHVGPELYELLQRGGSAELREALTVFDSTGWALEDLVAMELLVEWCADIGAGTELQLESMPIDPKNPYLLDSNDIGGFGSDRHQRGQT